METEHAEGEWNSKDRSDTIVFKVPKEHKEMTSCTQKRHSLHLSSLRADAQ
jgi:hypothetical protein